MAFLRGSFEAPDGNVFERDIVHHPGAVAMVPVTDRGTILFVRQYRGAMRECVLEIPAGARDVDGEDPAITAQRELVEEVGMEAGTMVELATIMNSPGFCDQRTVIFLATDLTPVPHNRHGPEEEELEVVEVGFDEVDSLVAGGELMDAESIVGVDLARRHLAALAAGG